MELPRLSTAILSQCYVITRQTFGKKTNLIIKLRNVTVLVNKLLAVDTEQLKTLQYIQGNQILYISFWSGETL
jgi:hypothetical protein